MVEQIGDGIYALMQNDSGASCLQIYNRTNHCRNQASQCLQEIGLAASVGAIDNTNRQEIACLGVFNQGVCKFRQCCGLEIKHRFIPVGLEILKGKLTNHIHSSFRSFIIPV